MDQWNDGFIAQPSGRISNHLEYHDVIKLKGLSGNYADGEFVFVSENGKPVDNHISIINDFRGKIGLDLVKKAVTIDLIYENVLPYQFNGVQPYVEVPLDAILPIDKVYPLNSPPIPSVAREPNQTNGSNK